MISNWLYSRSRTHRHRSVQFCIVITTVIVSCHVGTYCLSFQALWWSGPAVLRILWCMLTAWRNLYFIASNFNSHYQNTDWAVVDRFTKWPHRCMFRVIFHLKMNLCCKDWLVLQYITENVERTIFNTFKTFWWFHNILIVLKLFDFQLLL